MKNKENAKMNTMRKTTKCAKKSKAKNRETMMNRMMKEWQRMTKMKKQSIAQAVGT